MRTFVACLFFLSTLFLLSFPQCLRYTVRALHHPRREVSACACVSVLIIFILRVANVSQLVSSLSSLSYNKFIRTQLLLLAADVCKLKIFCGIAFLTYIFVFNEYFRLLLFLSLSPSFFPPFPLSQYFRIAANTSFIFQPSAPDSSLSATEQFILLCCCRGYDCCCS